MTPEQLQAWRWEREIDERNRPLTDEELDAMFPEGYKVCVFLSCVILQRLTHTLVLLAAFGSLDCTQLVCLHRSCLHQQAMYQFVLRPASCRPHPPLSEA